MFFYHHLIATVCPQWLLYQINGQFVVTVPWFYHDLWNNLHLFYIYFHCCWETTDTPAFKNNSEKLLFVFLTSWAQGTIQRSVSCPCPTSFINVHMDHKIHSQCKQNTQPSTNNSGILPHVNIPSWNDPPPTHTLSTSIDTEDNSHELSLKTMNMNVSLRYGSRSADAQADTFLPPWAQLWPSELPPILTLHS